MIAGDLHFGAALTLGKVICGGVFLFCVIKALRDANRGDMFDGHAHFRNLFYAGLVSLILFGALSGVSSKYDSSGSNGSSGSVRQSVKTGDVAGDGNGGWRTHGRR